LGQPGHNEIDAANATKETILEQILKILHNIQQGGSFYARKNADPTHLRISIKNAHGSTGDLTFPVSARAAKALIKLATPAKYGWRDQTLYDPGIRNGWEIKKSKFQIDNRLWNKTLTPILAQFKSGLGLPPESRLTAHLHNLLVYEKGQFFSPHQDSEKLDGMVASLVVILPSEFRGGTLAIDHHGEKKRFTAGKTSKEKLTLVAFYADCPHEVTPVTEGYRLALTYNLVLKNVDSPPSPSASHRLLTDALSQPMHAYFNPPPKADEPATKTSVASAHLAHDHARKFIYLLDHQYTQGSLQWNRLKNEDQARLDALRQVASKLDLAAHLALVDIEEIWNCEEDYDDRWSYRRRKYRHYNDDNVTEENTAASGYVLHELITEDLYLTHCIDEQNQIIDTSRLALNGSEICWTKATNQFDPFQSDYEGYMGNYGNTLDRWYHRAAVVLWRHEDRYAVLCEINANAAVKELLQLATAKETRPEAQKKVAGMLPYWERNASRTTDARLADNRLAGNVFKLALKIELAELAHALLLPLGIKAVSPETAKTLAGLAQAYGDAWCLRVFTDWTSSKPRRGNSCASLDKFGSIFESLIATRKASDALIDWLFEYQFEQLKKEHSFLERASAQGSKNKMQPMLELFYAATWAANAKTHAVIIDYLVRQSALFSMFDLALTVEEVSSRLDDDAFQAWGYWKLLDFTIGRLKARVSNGLRAGDDWSIEQSSDCTCELCGRLNQFLSSRTQRCLTWPLNKERRAHIHRAIDGLDIPVTHQTRREGSPQKLIVAKTDQIFSLDQQEFKNAKRELAILEKLKCHSKK